MSYIKPDFIDRLMSKVDIVDVIYDFVQLKKAGANYSGKSPFTEERTGSFMVSPAKGIFKDFSSGKGGNVVNFLMEYKKWTYPEAIEHLAAKYCEVVEYDNSEEAKKIAEKNQRKDKEYRPVLKAVLEQYKKAYKNLPPDSPARIEIEQKRLYDEEIILEWQIGFVPEARMNYENLSATGNIEIAKELNLINEKGNEKYWNRIIYPIHDDRGLLVGLAGRSIVNDNAAKWINPNENILYNKDVTWFGLHKAKDAILKANRAWIVEGYNDVISLHKIGLDLAVASCGTSITKSQIKILKKYTDHVVLALDGDSAGIKSTLKYIPEFLQNGFRIQVFQFSEGVDPDDFTRTENVNHKEVLEDKNSLTDGFALLLEHHITGDEIEITKGAKELLKIISKIKDDSYKEVYLGWLAKSSGIKATTLNKWLKEENETVREILPSFSEYELPADVKVPFKDIEKTIKTYGLFMANNQIYIMEDLEVKKVFRSVSNFSIEILQHMRDEKIPMKLYRMKNIFGQEVIFDAPSELINTPQAFEKMVTDHGNFRFKGARKELEAIKTYLFDQMGTGQKIEVLGWQQDGFWVWNNKVSFPNGTMMELDKNGLFTYNDTTYYVPSANSIYARNRTKYQAQKKFRVIKTNVTFEEYATHVKTVHREHGISGILFAIASIFQDIVEEELSSFPILFLYGLPSSGKDNLASAIQSFTGIPQQAINLESGASTLKANIREFAQFTNGISHLSEYKRGDSKIDGTIKSLWDRRGYKRGNITSDIGVDEVPILSSVILTGNDYPDNEAIITRVIWNEMNKNKFTDEETKNYEKLKNIINAGISSIADGLIKYREKFKTNFTLKYNSYKSILQGFIPDAESRIIGNLSVLGATYEILKDEITFPFDQNEMTKHFINTAEAQIRLMTSTSILSKWWFSLIASLRGHRDDRLQLYRDFKIEGTFLFFNFTNVYNKIQRQWWIQYHEAMPGKSAMVDSLRKSAYYREERKSERLSEGRAAIKTSVIILDLDHMPEEIAQDIRNGAEYQIIEGGMFDNANTSNDDDSDIFSNSPATPKKNKIISGNDAELPL
jgi:DNA primase